MSDLTRRERAAQLNALWQQHRGESWDASLGAYTRAVEAMALREAADDLHRQAVAGDPGRAYVIMVAAAVLRERADRIEAGKPPVRDSEPRSHGDPDADTKGGNETACGNVSGPDGHA